jgi:tripeptidyl-peptidase-2
MDITIRDGRSGAEDTDSATRMFVFHVIQLIPHAAYCDYETKKYLHLLPSQTSINSISVEAGVTCEVDIGRYWSTAGASKVDVTIEFRGVRPVPSEVALRSGDSFGLVRLQSDLRNESINPSAKYTKWKTPLRPKSEAIVTPLGERDVQPWNDKKTYQLVLHYEFSQEEKGSFTPRASALQNFLYESIYESQLMLAYDGDKKYLGYCDAYPQPISAPKGNVVIKMQIRHDEPSMLEKLKDMVIWIERKLDKEISVACYATREDLLVGGKRTMKKRTLRKGSCTSVFFPEPSHSKIPPSCKLGDVLMGSALYCSDDISLPGDGKRPNGFPISFTVGPRLEKSSSEGETEPKDERTAEERLIEAIRDLKVNQLVKLTTEEKAKGVFKKTFDELLKEYPGYLPLLIANLKYIDTSKKRSELFENILEAADNVIAEISEDELALHFGKKVDQDNPEKVKTNKKFETRKTNLIDALVRKALVFAEANDLDSEGSKFDHTLVKLKSWVDIDTNGKYAALSIERDSRLGNHGLVLKRLNKLISRIGSKDTGGVKPLTKINLLEKRREVLEKLGYDALVERDRTMRLIAAPPDYKLF